MGIIPHNNCKHHISRYYKDNVFNNLKYLKFVKVILLILLHILTFHHGIWFYNIGIFMEKSSNFNSNEASACLWHRIWRMMHEANLVKLVVNIIYIIVSLYIRRQYWSICIGKYYSYSNPFKLIHPYVGIDGQSCLWICVSDVFSRKMWEWSSAKTILYLLISITSFLKYHSWKSNDIYGFSTILINTIYYFGI